MKKFPNKMIREAYESAKGKVFYLNTGDNSLSDETGSKDYNQHALQWLYHRGIMQRTINKNFEFEYRIVK